MNQNLYFTNALTVTLDEILSSLNADKYFVLMDTHTQALCYSLIDKHSQKFNFRPIVITPGDDAKTLEATQKVWIALTQAGATRRSVLINLGGGMITDLGGFAASCYNRGMRFVNIPTTLLGAVDAAVGGKTGINFEGIKNKVGVFSAASDVLISSIFLHTLDHENLCSGYAEMLKHALIDNPEHFKQIMAYDLSQPQITALLPLMELSIRLKESVVKQDPYEKGLRKSLNFGHTIAHAFESFAFEQQKTLLHGYAVAWGVVCELILSTQQCGFPSETLHQVASFVKKHYGVFAFDCKAYEQLYNYMTYDKKNEDEHVNFTLLKGVGQVEINQTACKEQLFIMFDIYRDLMGI